jgi:hypothetical protein
MNSDIQNDNKIKVFKCDVCNKILASKYSVERHKKTCKIAKNQEKNVNPNLKNVNSNLKNVNSIFEKNKISCKLCNKNYKTVRSLKEHEKKCKGLDVLTCPKCMKTFGSRFSKSNHIRRGNCEARSIIYANTNITNNTINNITNNTINNNIIINNYGNERTDYITFDDMIRILKDSGNSVIPRYIQMKHFNKGFPENNNIKYDDNKGCLIKKDNEWRNVCIDNLSKKLMNHNSNEIGVFYNKNKDKINKIFKDMEFLEFINTRFNYLDLHLDKKLFNDLKNEIKYIIKGNILI